MPTPKDVARLRSVLVVEDDATAALQKAKGEFDKTADAAKNTEGKFDSFRQASSKLTESIGAVTGLVGAFTLFLNIGIKVGEMLRKNQESLEDYAAEAAKFQSSITANVRATEKFQDVADQQSERLAEITLRLEEVRIAMDGNTYSANRAKVEYAALNAESEKLRFNLSEIGKEAQRASEELKLEEKWKGVGASIAGAFAKLGDAQGKLLEGAEELDKKIKKTNEEHERARDKAHRDELRRIEAETQARLRGIESARRAAEASAESLANSFGFDRITSTLDAIQDQLGDIAGRIR